MDEKIIELINAIKANDLKKTEELLPNFKQKDLDDYWSVVILGEAPDFEFISPAVAAVTYSKNSEMIKLLLGYNINFKAQDPSGREPTAYEMAKKLAKNYSDLLHVLDVHYAPQDESMQKVIGDSN